MIVDDSPIKVQKKYREDKDSALEFGEYNQVISDSSMIDLAMLSDTFNDENQERLIREKEEKEYLTRLKSGKKSVAFKDVEGYDPRIYKLATTRMSSLSNANGGGGILKNKRQSQMTVGSSTQRNLALILESKDYMLSDSYP